MPRQGVLVDEPGRLGNDLVRPVTPFTLVAFAFLGLGLVIAMLADNVPAVQALGQCLFLPMLIIGGIAVPQGGRTAVRGSGAGRQVV